MSRLLALTSLFVVAASCGTASSTPALTFHHDVEPIVQKSCGNCHATGGIAPFPLETYEQVKAQASAIADAVSSKRMPPWMPSDSCGQPFVGDIHLEQADIDTLVAWTKSPLEGNPADAPTTKATLATLPHVDTTVKMSAAYTPDATLTDDYRCFVIDPALATTRFVTGYNIIPGVNAEVHHVILYVVDRAQALAEDAKDTAPGWQCFGGTGINTKGALGVWAPGAGAVAFPSGTGVAFGPDSVIAMQVHYNTRAGVRVPDQTQAQLMFADRAVTNAYLVPIVGDGFSIPPNSTGYSYTFDQPNQLGFDLDVWGFLPHMHTRGRHITMTTDSTCLVDIPKWDFHWQRVYFRPKPTTLKAGGKLSLNCTWDNPEARTITWGEGTSDEMCFAFVYTTVH